MLKQLFTAIKTFVSKIYSLGNFLLKIFLVSIKAPYFIIKTGLEITAPLAKATVYIIKKLLEPVAFILFFPISLVFTLCKPLFERFANAFLLPLAIKFRSPLALNLAVKLGANIDEWLNKTDNKENVSFVLKAHPITPYSIYPDIWLQSILRAIRENRVGVLEAFLEADPHYNTCILFHGFRLVYVLDALQDFTERNSHLENYEVLNALIQNDMFFQQFIITARIHDNPYFKKFVVKKINSFFTNLPDLNHTTAEELINPSSILLALLLLNENEIEDHEAKIQYIFEPFNRLYNKYFTQFGGQYLTEFNVATQVVKYVELKAINQKILQRAIKFNHINVVHSMFNYAANLSHVLDHQQELWNYEIRNAEFVQNFINDYFINFELIHRALESAEPASDMVKLAKIIFEALLKLPSNGDTYSRILQLLLVNNVATQVKYLEKLLSTQYDADVISTIQLTTLISSFIENYFTNFERSRVALEYPRPFNEAVNLALLILEALLKLPRDGNTDTRALQLLAFAHVASQAHYHKNNGLLALAVVTQNPTIKARLLELPDVARLAVAERQIRRGERFTRAGMEWPVNANLNINGNLDNNVINFRTDNVAESSTHALNAEERKILERIQAKYQHEVNKLGGANEVIKQLREYLATRYQANPATITINNNVISLPLLWEDLEQLRNTLSMENYEAALKAYYVNGVHTAYRFFLKPNHMIMRGAEYVEWQGSDAPYAKYDGYIPLIAVIWLAASDKDEIVNPNIPEQEQINTAMRIDNFINVFAHFNRSHNRDNDPNKDDLLGDNPSCFSGMNRQIFEIPIGHSLYQGENNLVSPFLLRAKLNALIKDYYKKLFTKYSFIDLIALEATLNSLIVDDFDEIASPIKIMEMVPNIPEDKQQEIFTELAKEFNITTTHLSPAILDSFNKPDGHFFSLYSSLDLKTLLPNYAIKEKLHFYIKEFYRHLLANKDLSELQELKPQIDAHINSAAPAPKISDICQSKQNELFAHIAQAFNIKRAELPDEFLKFFTNLNSKAGHFFALYETLKFDDLFNEVLANKGSANATVASASAAPRKAAGLKI